MSDNFPEEDENFFVNFTEVTKLPSFSEQGTSIYVFIVYCISILVFSWVFSSYIIWHHKAVVHPSGNFVITSINTTVVAFPTFSNIPKNK